MIASNMKVQLTKWEREVIEKRAAGFTFRQIGILMGLHWSTAQSDEQSACDKLGIVSKGPARRWLLQAYLEKLVPPTMADECF